MGRKLHGIMVSLPYQGHVTPFVNLAIKLASKGFIITFAHLEFVDHLQSKSQNSGESNLLPFSEERESGLDIRYRTISDGFPLEFDRIGNAEEYWTTMDRDFPGRAANFINKTIEDVDISDPGTAHFVITDTMFTWGPSVAKKLNLLHVSFWPEPALVFSLAYHIHLLKQNGHFPCKENVVEEVDYLPGVEPIRTKDFLTYFREAEADSLLQKATIVAFEEVKKSDFILHNTVQELESATLSALNKYHQPNYAIGPVSFTTKDMTSSSSASSLWLEADCTNWLSSKPPSSVLYVSFGSLLENNKKFLEEIGYGLVLSDVNFIWVVRDNADTLPDGIAKERGLIVPWCNQVQVLSNPAVGGFLTHNGWNSTLESIWFGVPMISYPMHFEQPVNRKLVVDDWKIGINLCDNHVTSGVDRKQVAEKINTLFCGSTVAKSLRKEVKEVSTILKNAVRVDGSSERNLDRFIKDLEAKIFT